MIETILIIFIVIILIGILVELKSIKNITSAFYLNDPLYPVFDRNNIKLACDKFLHAKEEYDRMQAISVNKTYDSLEKFDQEYIEAKINFNTAQENMYRKIQANISALNGKEILALQEEHREWYTSKIFGDPQTVIAELKELEKRRINNKKP
jgi:hypothetical protein